MENSYRKTYVEIDNSIIHENARILSGEINCKYKIAVVKGNAYGHGYGINPALREGGMNAFAVSKLEEALEVRKYDKACPVIMLQPVHGEYLGLCAQNGISVCINDEDAFKAAALSGERLKLHLKIDSGMNRLGLKDKTVIDAIYKEICANENLTLEGIFTHYHTNGKNDNEYANNRKRFEELTADIPLDKIPIVHTDRTQTALLHELPPYETGVRIGIALYGTPTLSLSPSSVKGKIKKALQDIKNSFNHVEKCKSFDGLNLKYAYSLYTEVIQVKKTVPGDYVGYGLFHKCEKEEYIAVIDIGYADGIGKKRYQSKVMINGKKYQIIGDVGMGMCEVLVDENVKKYDRVSVIGGGLNITDVTIPLKTTVYEALTVIESSIPRIYIN